MENLIAQSLVPNSLDARIQVWDVRTGKLIHGSPNITWRANTDISPDGKTYVTAGTGASFQVLDLMTDKEIQSFREEQFWALFSPNGQSLVVQGQDGMKIVR